MERRIVDGVRSGKRTGVSPCGFCALSVPARFYYHDRLGSCCRARGGHELPGVDDGLDVKQDGAGCAIECEEVQKIADIYINDVAERGDCRESDLPSLRIVSVANTGSSRSYWGR